MRTVRVLVMGSFPCADFNVWLQKFIGFVTTVKICLSVAFYSHTHTHTQQSKVLKLYKICNLRFSNTPLYSLDIPPPECLLLGFVRNALGGYNLPVSKKWRNQCMHGLPFSQNFFFSNCIVACPLLD